ncbi:hypothetical protein ACOSP7_016815 [Xanthoceras sorbifolium]
MQSQRPISTARPGQSATSIASTLGSTAREPALVLCEHCGKRHPGECWRVTGACNRCGSRDHFYRDCPKNQTTPIQQPESSAPTASRGRRSSQAGTEGSNHIRVPESAARQYTRTPARAYAIKAQEDKDASYVIAE